MPIPSEAMRKKAAALDEQLSAQEIVIPKETRQRAAVMDQKMRVSNPEAYAQPGEPEQKKEGFSISEMVGNIPESAQKYGRDMLHPLLHPKETYQAFKELGPEGVVTAMKDMYKTRYGTPEDALQTIEDDPVGVLADLSFVLSPVGLLSKAPGAVGKAAKVVGEVGKTIDPLNLARVGIKGTAKAVIPEKLPAKMYDKAVKITGKDHMRRSETAVKNQLLPNQEGLDKATAIIDDLDDVLKTELAKASGKGAKIATSSIDEGLLKVIRKYGPPDINAEQNLNQVLEVAQKIRRSISGRKYLTPEEANKIKQSLQKNAQFDKKGGLATEAKLEAYRQGSREIRKEIETQAKSVGNPVGDINKELSDLYDLVGYKSKEGPLASAAKGVQRSNFWKWATPFNLTAGHVIGGPAGVAVMAAVSLAENPLMRARAALLLHRIQQTGLMEKSLPFEISQYVTQSSVQAGRVADEYKGITIPITEDSTAYQEQ